MGNLMNADKVLAEVLKSYQEELEAELKGIVGAEPLALYDMLRYHMGWQDEHGRASRQRAGKLIRPSLCLLSCQAVGGDAWQILPAAAALELIHNFSLIHDDIEDNDLMRHNRLTVWKLWGQAQGINAGDAMFGLAYLALLGLKEKGIADAKTVHCAKMLSETCLQLCEGQYLDMSYENRLDVTIEEYLSMIAKKTAALLGTSSFLGAFLGTDDESRVACFHQFGKELGLAFQIHDDILGIWGVEERTGKSKSSDIAKRKKTLPVLYGLGEATAAVKEELAGLYSQESIEGEDISKVAKVLDEMGARGYAQALAKQHYHQSLAHLEATGLPVSQLTQLKELVCSLMERNY
jgi:geranylgeranyl diphosphate synthase type I